MTEENQTTTSTDTKTEATTTDTGTTATPVDTKADESLVKNVDLGIKDEKTADTEAEDSKDSTETKESEGTKEDSKDAQLSADELNYGNYVDNHGDLVQFATELQVPAEKLKACISNDGKVDTSSLTDLSTKDRLTLKMMIEAEVGKAQATQQATIQSLHNAVGGKESFQSMVEWANTAMKNDAKLQEEVRELHAVMKEGGIAGNLAAKELYSKFKAAPQTNRFANVTTPMQVTGENQATTQVFANAHQEKRHALDNGWAKFAQTHKK